MKIFKILFTTSMFLLLALNSYSQQKERKKIKGSLNAGTIESQFDYIYVKSFTYKNTKSVKMGDLQKIKSNVLDSINTLKKELSETKEVVQTQNIEINSLKSDLTITNDNLTSVTKEKDAIKFLGFPMTKTGYNTLLWSIITGLLVFLIFFIYKFKASNTITKQANELLVETEDEFETYKATALEREQKVRRELQDELNKQKYSSKKSKKE
ncbi:MAG: tRNA (guanine-N1)-methyltransferase [Flavobacteriaceae bacterium]|nr:tRNA (guanine-N1)-methyltransferase [Flavobacteriaceae bacterium]